MLLNSLIDRLNKVEDELMKITMEKELAQYKYEEWRKLAYEAKDEVLYLQERNKELKEENEKLKGKIEYRDLWESY